MECNFILSYRIEYPLYEDGKWWDFWCAVMRCECVMERTRCIASSGRIGSWTGTRRPVHGRARFGAYWVSSEFDGLPGNPGVWPWLATRLPDALLRQTNGDCENDRSSHGNRTILAAAAAAVSTKQSFPKNHLQPLLSRRPKKNSPRI